MSTPQQQQHIQYASLTNSSNNTIVDGLARVAPGVNGGTYPRCICARPLVLDPRVPAHSRCLSGIAVRQASMSGTLPGSLVRAGCDLVVSLLQRHFRLAAFDENA
eukprot:scaffold73110_cov49-Attheya_sp.AAC.2